MKSHIFNLEDALKYGIEEAILLYNITYWIEKNKANNKHFYDGYYWTYNSYKAFQILFPYLSESQIKRAVLNLENNGAIISGNYNQSPYDKTKWYRLNQTKEQTKSSITKDENDQPIPNVNTDINKNIKQKKSGKQFIKPTLEEVESFFLEKGFNKQYAKQAFDFYDITDWVDSRGNKVLNWKQKMNGIWLTEDKRTEKNTSNKPQQNKPVNPLDEILEWNGTRMTRREYNKIFG